MVLRIIAVWLHTTSMEVKNIRREKIQSGALQSTLNTDFKDFQSNKDMSNEVGKTNGSARDILLRKKDYQG